MTEKSETITQAVREIRREGYKAALLHATVDAIAVFLLANLGVRLLGVSLPAVGPVDGSLLVAGCVGLGALGLDGWVRARQYTLERFEADNPVVADALRTARDSAAVEADSPMAERLYEEVLDRLDRTSATGFVDARWLAGSILVVMLVSGLTVQVAVAGVSFAPTVEQNVAENGSSGGGSGGGPVGGTDNGDSELQDGDSVLGEPKDVANGTDDLRANITGARGGEEGDQERAYDDSGLSAGDDAVTAQQAGFDAERNLGDADLVREYNLRLQASDSNE